MRPLQRFCIAFAGILIICAAGNSAGPDSLQITKIEIVKSRRELTTFHDTLRLKTYRIALGKCPRDKKEREGDNKTPEGIYRIDRINYTSNYYRSLHITYPNKDDSLNARLKRISPGGAIMIHGVRNGFSWIGRFHRLIDWTAGCIALTNIEIDEIIEGNPLHSTVIIKP